MHFMFTLDVLLIVGVLVGLMGWDLTKPDIYYERDPIEQERKLKISKMWRNVAIMCSILGVICVLGTALAFDL